MIIFVQPKFYLLLRDSVEVARVHALWSTPDSGREICVPEMDSQEMQHL